MLPCICSTIGRWRVGERRSVRRPIPDRRRHASAPAHQHLAHGRAKDALRELHNARRNRLAQQEIRHFVRKVVAIVRDQIVGHPVEKEVGEGRKGLVRRRASTTDDGVFCSGVRRKHGSPCDADNDERPRFARRIAKTAASAMHLPAHMLKRGPSSSRNSRNNSFGSSVIPISRSSTGGM